MFPDHGVAPSVGDKISGCFRPPMADLKNQTPHEKDDGRDACEDHEALAKGEEEQRRPPPRGGGKKSPKEKTPEKEAPKRAFPVTFGEDPAGEDRGKENGLL